MSPDLNTLIPWPELSPKHHRSACPYLHNRRVEVLRPGLRRTPRQLVRTRSAALQVQRQAKSLAVPGALKGPGSLTPEIFSSSCFVRQAQIFSLFLEASSHCIQVCPSPDTFNPETHWMRSREGSEAPRLLPHELTASLVLLHRPNSRRAAHHVVSGFNSLQSPCPSPWSCRHPLLGALTHFRIGPFTRDSVLLEQLDERLESDLPRDLHDVLRPGASAHGDEEQQGERQPRAHRALPPRGSRGHRDDSTADDTPTEHDLPTSTPFQVRSRRQTASVKLASSAKRTRHCVMEKVCHQFQIQRSKNRVCSNFLTLEKNVHQRQLFPLRHQTQESQRERVSTTKLITFGTHSNRKIVLLSRSPYHWACSFVLWDAPRGLVHLLVAFCSPCPGSMPVRHDWSGAVCGAR